MNPKVVKLKEEREKNSSKIASLQARNKKIDADILAIENTDIRLWGDDNAHTSDEGAYLAVCVHFATIFGKSATILDENGIEDAKILQEIADKIVFGG